MRLFLSHDDQKQLENFSAILAAEGIETQIKSDDGQFQLWILDEDQRSQCEILWKKFSADPSSFTIPKDKPTPNVETRRSGTNRARFIKVRDQNFYRGQGQGQLTFLLIAVCVLATLVLDLPTYQAFKGKLFFSEFYGRSFPEIRSGQIWRLVTPALLHGGMLHLLFNMLWLFELGRQLEIEEGKVRFVLTIVIFASIVNTAQYLVSGPAFVGMSGVLYGLLGYVWMMEKYSRKFHYGLAQGTVTMMIIWMIVCLVGIIPNVANTQHVVGFAIGTFWGFIRSGELKLWIRQKIRKMRQPKS